MMRSVIACFFLVACSSSEQPSAAPVDSGGTEVATGGACVFNDDCPESQRCDCVDAACACHEGARGTGASGVDACMTGADCASGLCVEGTSGFVCSGPCDAGCGAKLPKCTDVAGIGSICTREPSSSGAEGSFSGKTWAFDHAYFGFDYSGTSATSLEIQAGSDGSCPPPKKDPQATIVVAGLPGTLAAMSYPSIKATLLGIDPALPLHSTATEVNLALSSIRDCAGADTFPCTFDVTVDLAFAEGTVKGTVHAIHCASMDVH
jgi:hypothetical protein